jgi:hypothetical protein
MNESMRSVADIPGDDTVDDDLAGISPELVLIDPELARLVRERQADETPSTALRPATLRLVEGGSDEAPIVPRSVETVPPPPAAPIVKGATASAPVVEPPPEQIVPRTGTSSAPELEQAPEETVPVPAVEPEPIVEEPVLDVLPIPAEAGLVARRVIEAEPARAVPPPEVEEPAPLVPDRLADFTVPQPQEPTPGYSTMPHPVARPATQRRARPSAERRKRGSARGVFAFLVAVAIAAAAVLGITRLTAGSSDSPPGKGGTAAVGAPPVATKSGKKKAAASAKKAAAKKQSSASSKPRPAATKPAVTKPAATQKKSGTKTSPNPKTQAATKPKTQVTAKPKTQTTAKPKPTASKPKTAATPPKKSAAAPATGEARRFAWAPVSGAVGYHVELFRGNDRVLAQDTKEPVLELAPSWRYQGRTVTLTPGEYRWYVWPVTASGRGTEAVVQAKLNV